ncbi:KAP family P-loop NTPase fold protein [Flexibacterium corallicola]|uniref:KAP family P-loop NTPase fold protein n=1 Tax=Flexibacterium corallicola TaxID=3037259 RepID=UPI00286F1F38|nr:P-loop NTPase fold protein [Pseudovibrio sp. M1P-2-3]
MSAIHGVLQENISLNEAAKKKALSTFKAAGGALLSIAKSTAKTQLKKYTGEAVENITELFTGEAEADEGTLENSKSEAGASKDAGGKEFKKAAQAELAKLADSLFKEHDAKKQTVTAFKNSVGNLLNCELKEGSKPPLFVLIDELDRCRPTYAIELLERVKHLFSIPDVVFVLATNTEQLCHSINAVYGGNFDSKIYLQRFFDQTYTFEEPELEKFVKKELNHYPIKAISWPYAEKSRFIGYVLDLLGSNIREVSRIFPILQAISDTWLGQQPIVGSFILPRLIAHVRNIELIDNLSIQPNPLAPLEKERSDGDRKRLARRYGSLLKDGDYRDHYTGLVKFSPDLGSLPENDEKVRSGFDQVELQVIDLLYNELYSRYSVLNFDNSVPSFILGYDRLIKTAGRLNSDL